MDSDETVSFLRGKLIGQPRSVVEDAYAAARQRQCAGLECEHCHSMSGHYGHCPLINRESAEVMSAARFDKYSEQDVIHAHALGIQL